MGQKARGERQDRRHQSSQPGKEEGHRTPILKTERRGNGMDGRPAGTITYGRPRRGLHERGAWRCANKQVAGSGVAKTWK